MIKIIVSGLAGIKLSFEEQVMVDKKEMKIKNLIEKLLEKRPEIKEYLDPHRIRPRPGILVLLNGIDINLLLDNNISEVIDNSKIELKIIPVNHGG